MMMSLSNERTDKMKTVDICGVRLRWPAVKIVLGGKEIVPDNDQYEDADLRVHVSLEQRGEVWFKHLSVTAKRDLPTPDYVEMDLQSVPDGAMRLCGYMDAAADENLKPGSEEATGNAIPGCGYPLIGARIFTGLAHQAGFARIEEQTSSSTTYSLRHHPVWEGKQLGSMEAVFCVSDNPMQSFREYIDAIRAPLPLEPFFAFCSFWSDPYEGNFEYKVTREAMHKFIGAYQKLGLHPDVYTFDAGWFDRNTCFQPKKGLEPENFPPLSLWVSHNGPMGMSPDFLRKEGIAVGSGWSSSYCGKDYGVLLDPKLEKMLAKRFCELAAKVFHFKIDWDNDCATTADFKDKYPTRDHVREGSINAMNRIMQEVRKVNPSILVRNGWWPSPWWLVYATHVFLSKSGDSEYATLPALHQRASAATHRDLMYYNHLCRDHSMVPLSSYDNHEFPNSIRNVFDDSDAVWTDNLVHCLLRGSTYFTWTIQPESLSNYHISTMKQLMAFARKNAKHIFVKDSFMFGGNPGLGEVYGFCQNYEGESWAMLRNPHPMPQCYKLPDFLQNAVQVYPDYRKLPSEITLLPEDVRFLIVSKKRQELPYDIPFQAFFNKNQVEFYFPSTMTVTDQICPMVDTIHQVPELKMENVSFDATGQHLLFSVTSPYRMKGLSLRLCIKEQGSELRVLAHTSRYGGINTTSTFAAPVTEITPGKGSYGELFNPENRFNKKQRFFAIPVPAGGKTYFDLEFSKPIPAEALELWCIGYEGRSRECLKKKKAPLAFDSVLPLQHPDGFPMAIKLQI